MSESNQYNEQNTNNHQLSGTSPNFRTDLAKKLEELVPEAIADGKVDVVKLKELLAEDAGEPNERFGLFWPGKKQALRAAQDPTTATLKPAKDESKDWDTTNNIFIEGDNLEVLKVLQKQYHNSIKMIYIDPPYNTGKDFVYPDNFKEGLQNYLEFSQQVDEGNKKISTNTETAGRYHSNWLNMMYPRLKLARNLLTDDGVIFISIDDAEQANLKKICDEIFGEGNFMGQMVWHARGRSKTPLSIDHEYVFVYARHVSNIVPLFDTKGKEASWFGEPIERKYANPDNDPRGLWRDAQHTVTQKKAHYTYSVNRNSGEIQTGVVNNKEWYGHRTWMYAPNTIRELFCDNRLYFIDNGDRLALKVKKFQSEEESVTSLGGLIQRNDISSRHGSEEFDKIMGAGIFDYPKPTSFVMRFLRAATAKEDIILDFFAGSATTAHAIMQLNAEDGGNRKHIMVQLPEPTDEKSEAFKAGYKKISDIARERINRAGEKIKADFADKLAERETPLDVGYRTYKLADTNFTKWQSAPTGDLTELQARLDLMRESSNDNASEEDLLVEVLLKMGLPLTTRTKTVDIDGLHVHQVVAEGDSSEGQPVLYLNEHVKPTLEQLRAIITDLTPSKFVILDDAFQGDNQLKTNLVQTCKSYDVELWTV